MRKTDHPINPLIRDRWSPRAMTGEEINDAEWKSLLEAARWAPSSYDAQPWCFIYAKRNTPAFQTFVDLLVEFNKGWAPKAAVLCVIASRRLMERNNKPSRTHAFDAGAAWENLALEASSRGLVAHGMEGFDYEKAKTVLEIPDEFEVRAMFAVGKRAPKETLSPELQAKEIPSDRKKVEEFAMEGKFRK
ncbi:MAG TPA: nitroreductase family protein [Chlamydiales bacterium]